MSLAAISGALVEVGGPWIVVPAVVGEGMECFAGSPVGGVPESNGVHLAADLRRLLGNMIMWMAGQALSMQVRPISVVFSAITTGTSSDGGDPDQDSSWP
ncbi:hypothetical protein [Streptosporangium sp. NPDC001681]|uniref:hypothetical protein n=1 Tax=Streptosporangium sp. NPDC001681 TaxID=3154395 RepID=UPI003324D967